MTLGKSEALLKGEKATIAYELALISSKYEKLIEEYRLLDRKLIYANKVYDVGLAKIEALESGNTVVRFLLICALLISNLVTFGVMR